MLEQRLAEALLNAGVGTLTAVLVLVGLYRIANRLGEKFIEAQRSQAEALGAQAQAVEGLTTSVRDFVGRDASEHREILVLLRFIAQQQQALDEVKSEHNRRKEQAHPHCPLGTPED